VRAILLETNLERTREQNLQRRCTATVGLNWILTPIWLLK
jgi:hypothetical protein